MKLTGMKKLCLNYQLPKPNSAIALSRQISSAADHECSNKTKSSFCTTNTTCTVTEQLTVSRESKRTRHSTLAYDFVKY